MAKDKQKHAVCLRKFDARIAEFNEKAQETYFRSQSQIYQFNRKLTLSSIFKLVFKLNAIYEQHHALSLCVLSWQLVVCDFSSSVLFVFVHVP